MKCSHNILHANENGYVAQCRECRNVQVAFGTCLLTITEMEFKGFLIQVAGVVEGEAVVDCKGTKQFTYSTDSCKVSMVFSFSDLEKLYHLMSPAQLMILIGQMNQN